MSCYGVQYRRFGNPVLPFQENDIQKYKTATLVQLCSIAQIFRLVNTLRPDKRLKTADFLILTENALLQRFSVLNSFLQNQSVPALLYAGTDPYMLLFTWFYCVLIGVLFCFRLYALPVFCIPSGLPLF